MAPEPHYADPALGSGSAAPAPSSSPPRQSAIFPSWAISFSLHRPPHVSHWPIRLHVFHVLSLPEPPNDSIELRVVDRFFRAQHVCPTRHRANVNQHGAGVTADLV